MNRSLLGAERPAARVLTYADPAQRAAIFLR